MSEIALTVLATQAGVRELGSSVQCARDCRPSFNAGERYLKEIVKPNRINR